MAPPQEIPFPDSGESCSLDRGEEDEEPSLPQEYDCVLVLEYEMSERGSFSAWKAGRQSTGFAVAWDANRLCLAEVGETDSWKPVAVLEWELVSSVWASLRTRPGDGFFLELILETSRGSVDFVRITASMDQASGRLLRFVQEEKAEQLKEGRGPWALSRWAAPLYQRGLSSKRLRVACGWTSTIFEVLFAVAFLAQLRGISGSRGNKLLTVVSDMSRDLGGLGSLTTCTMLVQHLLVFLVVLRSLWSTGWAALGSLRAFHHAGKKAHKSVKKRLNSTDMGRRNLAKLKGAAKVIMLHKHVANKKAD